MVTNALNTDNWITITEYMEILKPFKYATKKLEGRTKEGRIYLLKIFIVKPSYDI